MSSNATMKTQPFVVTPKDYNRPLNVLGTKVTVLASNAATQAYEITLDKAAVDRLDATVPYESGSKCYRRV